MELFWLFFLNQPPFYLAIVTKHPIWTSMSVHKLVLHLATYLFYFLFCLRSVVIPQNACNSFVSVCEDHDVFIDCELKCLFLIFLHLIIGHRHNLGFFMGALAHSAMEVPAELNQSLFKGNLAQNIVGIHLLFDVFVFPGFPQVHVAHRLGVRICADLHEYLRDCPVGCQL